MPAAPFDLSVVIPTYNGLRLLEICLASLRRQTLPPREVIVVDNGSDDGSPDWLRRRYPEVSVLVLPENRGFGAAVNAGIAKGRGQWLLLLNNDVELAPDCLQRLQEGIGRFPGQLWFALKMLQFQDRRRLDGAGDAMFLGGAGYRLGTMERDAPCFDRERLVFGACAGAALYQRGFFDRVGCFDADFFAYLEDLDLNIRAARQGLSCRFLPRARVYHMGSATSGSPLNPFTARLTTRNMWLILIKHYPLRAIPGWLPMILGYQLLWAFFLLRRRLAGAYLSGLREARELAPRMRLKRRRLATAEWTTADEWFRSLPRAERAALASVRRRRLAEGRCIWPLDLYLRLFHPVRRG